MIGPWKNTVSEAVRRLWVQLLQSQGVAPVFESCHGLPLSRHAQSGSLLESLKDGLVWNTPKHRKSLERRRTERFGSLTWGTLKTVRQNKRLRVDSRSGQVYELGRLAPSIFQKVMQETKDIQKKMATVFSITEPKDKELVVVYKGEQPQHIPPKLRLVEMDKERPNFFSPNLMQKAIVAQDTNQTVRPTGLG